MTPMTKQSQLSISVLVCAYFFILFPFIAKGAEKIDCVASLRSAAVDSNAYPRTLENIDRIEDLTVEFANENTIVQL